MKPCQFHKTTARFWHLALCPIALLICMLCHAKQSFAGDKPVLGTIHSSLSQSLNNLQMQQNPVVHNIIITGNEKTKAPVILREVPFQIGDTLVLDNLSSVLEETRNNITNTSLFKNVNMRVEKSGQNSISIFIEVKERWYIYPMPIFELADRNFNVWWNEHNHDLGRTVYGIRYIQQNLTGRGDRLKVLATGGFENRFWLEYRRPYIDRKKRFGLDVDLKYFLSKELAYGSDDNELQQHRGNDFLQKSLDLHATLTYRRKLHSRHALSIGYNQTAVQDTIKELNPFYFSNNKSAQKFLSLGYNFQFDSRDRKSYPLEGLLMHVGAKKQGFATFQNLDKIKVNTRYAHHFDLGNQFFFSHDLAAKLSLSDNKVYYEQPSLGYENFFVRGYEYYVMSGQFITLGKFELKRKLFSFTIDNTGLIDVDHFNNPPLKFFLKSYVDMGYVKDEFFFQNNPLNNSYLIGSGIGLDMVTYYDMSFRFEYSINHLYEHGFFFHIIQEF